MKHLVDIIVAPAQVPPTWRGHWFCLRLPKVNQCEIGDVQFFRMDSFPSDSNERTALDMYSAVEYCPLVAVMEPIGSPGGWVEPWIVNGPTETYASLVLPAALISAPALPSYSLHGAITAFRNFRERVDERRGLINVYERTEQLRDELRTLTHVSGEIWWYIPDNETWPIVTGYTDGNDLVGQLEGWLASAIEPIPHLITGLFPGGYPVW